MLKKSWLLPLLLILGGCVSSNNYYVLSTASQPLHHYAQKHRVIGVEKVIVPKYLFKREIAVAKTSSQITFLDGAVWAEDLDAGLTQRLIGFLQKKFNQPNVYAYPWGVERQPTVKVKVQITRFIAQGERVYLDADWEVENMHTHKRKARLFSTTVPTKRDASSIVSAMDSAFGRLEKDIAEGIKNF
ncbi:hypothetical protein MNB_SV-8-1355 [hydrothermal vent metagenome]|uniref:ABC-type transport auxiliary lipoprotein component domain-containing protein n=1 Tax=hydrothermal vent metagenome TaxID=652676 RepID=A0A1W1BGI4_9ZZZZ